MQTLSEENYLKLIYHLSEDQTSRISTSALAAKLGVSAASVSEKLQRMAEKNLIDYEKSRGVTLTQVGQRVALKVIRKHRIWETFLVKSLSFGWEEVHEIAEQLEHINSDKLIERIEKLLDYPRFDPHGEPIPDAKGKVSKSCFQTLNEIDENTMCRITGVKEDSVEFLHLFTKIGLSVGDTLEVKSIEAYDKSLLLKINQNKQVYLSREMSQNIWITTNIKCCVFEDINKDCPTDDER